LKTENQNEKKYRKTSVYYYVWTGWRHAKKLQSGW
jgi:hypothetical protein